MSNAISSFGIKLQMGDGSDPENFDDVAELQDIKGPGIKVDFEEVTNHGSPEGWEEVIPTILRAGEVTFDLNYIPSEGTHQDIVDHMTHRDLVNWKLVFPDAGNTTWQFAAYVADFEPEAPVKGKLGSSVKLRITGKPSLQ